MINLLHQQFVLFNRKNLP